MRRFALVTAVLAVAFATRVFAVTAVQSVRPCLVPWPQKVTMLQGSIAVPKSFGISTEADNAAENRVAETFASDVQALGFSPVLSGKQPTMVLRISSDKSLGDEGYRLKVGKNIEISAATETGLFWGTRTVLQLLAKGPEQPIQRMTVFDKPLLPMRVVMIDVARQFHTIGFHRWFVKRLASYKINVYHIHFNDDQSYTLPSDKYPNLPTPGRHYTKDELKDLVKLAEQYHVTIMPELETLGHNTAVTAAIPDAMCRGLGPRGLLCAGSDRSFNIMKTLISETMDIFPSHYFHIGADEVDFKAWDKCPDCEARKVSEGFATSESLYNWFINRVNRFVTSKGRRTVAWDGFKLTMNPAVDKNVLIDQWENGYANPLELLKSGYDLINSTDDPLYWVRPSASEPERIAEWDPWHFGRVRAGTPVMSPSKQLFGVGFCSWENTEPSQEACLFGTGKPVEGYAPAAPRVPIMAERGWTGNSTTAADLLERVGVTPN